MGLILSIIIVILLLLLFNYANCIQYISFVFDVQTAYRSHWNASLLAAVEQFLSHLAHTLNNALPLVISVGTQYERINDRKIRQSVKQEHRGTITGCACRCLESTIIQLRGTIDYVVKTQHYKRVTVASVLVE